MRTLITLLLSLSVFGYFECANATNIDSLKNELKSAAFPHDSLILLKAITESYQSLFIDSTYYYGEIAIHQANKLNDTASLADVYNYLGTACYYSAFYEKALDYYQKSKGLILLLNNKTNLAKIYNNMGNCYEISEKNDIAMEYFNKSLEIWRSINEHSPDDPETKKIIALLYNNMGIVNYKLGEKEKALEYYNKSLAISRNFKEKTSMSLSLHNIGIAYLFSNKYDTALEFLNQSLEISYEANDKQGIAASLNEIGNVYLKLKDYKKAGNCFNESLQIAENIRANEILMHAYRGLYLLNNETGNTESALQYIILYHQLNDSIFSQESKNKIAELQSKYEFEKKEQAIKLLEAEQDLNNIHLQNSRTWLYILIVGIAISLFFLGLIYFQMGRKKRANIELVRKNREIVKSEAYYKECLKVEQQNKVFTLNQNQQDKYAGSTLKEEQKEGLMILITETMDNERLYLKSDFTINILSKHLDVSRTYISQVINEKFNMNFNAFINEYRIKEARRMLTDEANKNLTIESIALSVGFGSKSVFNPAFKKYTGITPSFYMKSSR